MFNQGKVDTGDYGISWSDDLDLDAEAIWEDGIEVVQKEIAIIAELAENLINAREIARGNEAALAKISDEKNAIHAEHYKRKDRIIF